MRKTMPGDHEAKPMRRDGQSPERGDVDVIADGFANQATKGEAEGRRVDACAQGPSARKLITQEVKRLVNEAGDMRDLAQGRAMRAGNLAALLRALPEDLSLPVDAALTELLRRSRELEGYEGVRFEWFDEGAGEAGEG